jgi:hypothetical protein
MTEGEHEDTAHHDDSEDARKMSPQERQKIRGEQGTTSGDPHDDTDTDSGA